MMEPIWQYIIIGIAVAVAATYLAVHFIRKRRRKAVCENCLERIKEMRNH